MNWLITGGCGFIGLNLIKNLLDEGKHHIKIVDNLSVGTRKDLSGICRFREIDQKSLTFQSSTVNSGFSAVELIVADILDADIALKAVREIDIVVHLAANTGVPFSVKNPRTDCLNNVIGTLNYLEAARYNGVKRFVFASSSAAVGACEPPIHERITPRPVSPYGASKLAGEAYCSSYYHTFGIETVSLRFGNVYGPLSGKKNSVVAKFIKNAIEGKPLEIYGDGTQTRDFVFIDDLIHAIRLSAVKKTGGDVFQIATSMETSIDDFTDKLTSVFSDYNLKEVKKIYTEPRIGDVKKSYSDTSKAKKMLGWQSPTELKEGLQKTVKWFIKKQK